MPREHSRTARAARQPARTGRIPGPDAGVVAGGMAVVVIAVVCGGVAVITVVAGDVAGSYAFRTNVVLADESCSTAETVTMYSSGFQAAVSTGNDQELYPDPFRTYTVPDAPENSPLWAFVVGLNDDEMTSTIRASPAARLVEPVMANASPTR